MRQSLDQQTGQSLDVADDGTRAPDPPKSPPANGGPQPSSTKQAKRAKMRKRKAELARQKSRELSRGQPADSGVSVAQPAANTLAAAAQAANKQESTQASKRARARKRKAEAARQLSVELAQQAAGGSSGAAADDAVHAGKRQRTTLEDVLRQEHAQRPISSSALDTIRRDPPAPPPAPPPATAGASASARLPAFAPPKWSLLYKAHEIEAQLQPLMGETVLGIDIEWKPNFRPGRAENRVALLQLASATRCVLVPIKHLPALPPSLATLLGSPHIWKVGCGVGGDAVKLAADCGLACHATLEIGEVATRLQAAEGLTFPALADDERVRPGLAGLSLACGHELAKPKAISRSNWEARPLSARQQQYAALDAYAGVWIAHCLHALHAAQTGGGGELRHWLQTQAASLPQKHRAAQKRKEEAAQAAARAKPAGRKRQK